VDKTGKQNFRDQKVSQPLRPSCLRGSTVVRKTFKRSDLQRRKRMLLGPGGERKRATLRKNDPGRAAFKPLKIQGGAKGANCSKLLRISA